jgi:probable rRNA maturation factor
MFHALTNELKAFCLMVEIVNDQRRTKIDNERWRIFTAKALRVIKEAKGKGVTVAFVSDRKMRVLNRAFRGVGKTTDVLSFPVEQEEFEMFDNTLGDVVISIEQAERQAIENGLDLETEISQLILHGLLHLCGYDHETDNGEMYAYEFKLRRNLKI